VCRGVDFILHTQGVVTTNIPEKTSAKSNDQEVNLY